MLALRRYFIVLTGAFLVGCAFVAQRAIMNRIDMGAVLFIVGVALLSWVYAFAFLFFGQAIDDREARRSRDSRRAAWIAGLFGFATYDVYLRHRTNIGVVISAVLAWFILLFALSVSSR
jgi:uncharacterized membrane protein YhaH (DUF805 family)